MSAMEKIKALEYLIKNNVHTDEWRGAGMYVAIEKMMKYKGEITEKYLNKLLKEADEF